MAKKTQQGSAQRDAPAANTLDDDQKVVKMVAEYYKEAEAARRDRIAQNKRNWNAYFGNQDFSYKQAGQSKETIPKVAEAVEQFSAFVKRALTAFGDWFSVDVPKNSPISDVQARKLMRCALDKMDVGHGHTIQFPTFVSTAIKSGLLESMIVAKVHGTKTTQRSFEEVSGKLKKGKGRMIWRLKCDLVPNEDYAPDPTGRRLYEIHRVERDLIDVQKMAEIGIYDADAVAQIVTDYTRNDQDRRTEAERNQNETTPPGFRKRCVIDECWGTLLNPDGSINIEDGLCAVINEKILVRKPESNPYWHSLSPFVATSLVQVPYTVWGKALYDQAVSLNIALNELFNLMLDGGIAEVWGIRQVRTSWLQDPSQVSNGVPQGATLAINDQVPEGGKVVERVDDGGGVPAEAMAMYNLADREFQAASLVNDIRLGFLPPRAVKATEVVESSNNSAVILDSFSSDLEHEFIEPILYRVWMLIIQNWEDLPADEVVEAVGLDLAFTISRMSKAERYATFCQGYKFKVYGLSSTLGRAREFQKLMALMQAVGTNPMMMQAFMQKFSAEKALDFIMKSLNINPDTLMMTDEEAAQNPERLAMMQQLAQITGGAQNASPAGGQETTNGEINQNAAPSGGPAA